MITEIAQIEVKPGMEAEFEAGVKNAAPVFQRAKGCHGMDLQRSIEKPSRYRLFVKWATVENHTKDFRGSPDFQEWRNSSLIASPRRPKSSTSPTWGMDFRTVGATLLAALSAKAPTRGAPAAV